MSTLKEYIREVRDAAIEHLEARHRDDDTAPQQQRHISREKALATIALVTIRLLEQQLQVHSTDDVERKELQTHLKACRKALKFHRPAAEGANEAPLKRNRVERREGNGETAPASSSAASQAEKSKAVELGQYSSTDAFGQNEEKRLKFARLMGGAKAAKAAAAGSAEGSGVYRHHNTYAKSSAEVRRMNENLEKEFDSAMSHKGKKGLGA